MDTSKQLKHCAVNCSCSRLAANFTATNGVPKKDYLTLQVTRGSLDDESSSIKPFRDHLHGGRTGVQSSKDGWGGQARPQKEKTETWCQEGGRSPPPSQRKGIRWAVRRKLGTHHGRQEMFYSLPGNHQSQACPQTISYTHSWKLCKCEQTCNNNFCWSLAIHTSSELCQKRHGRKPLSCPFMEVLPKVRR